MNTSLATNEHAVSALKIKGRIMPYENFAGRLDSLCAALGFAAAGGRNGAKIRWAGGSLPDMPGQGAEEGEAVIVLSCRVAYNPHWGEFGGHPQLRLQAETNDELCPATFIAPFLEQYRFARDRIFLAMDCRGEHFITLPARLVEKTGDDGWRLTILLEQVAEPDRDGNIAPVKVSGSMYTYRLAGRLRRTIDRMGHVWQAERSFPIGRYFGSELFSFGDAAPASDRQELFFSTLFPHLGEIVGHPTPNLRAAEIHLGQLFARAVALLRGEAGSRLKHVLCLAGLDIDMSGFVDHEEQRCFVPWQAYLAGRGEARLLGQDDVFVRLMQASRL